MFPWLPAKKTALPCGAFCNTLKPIELSFIQVKPPSADISVPEVPVEKSVSFEKYIIHER